MGFSAAECSVSNGDNERRDRANANCSERRSGAAFAFEKCGRRSARKTRECRNRRNGWKTCGTGSDSVAVQRVQNTVDEKSGEARYRRSGGGKMGFLEWATSPWGQHVPIHIAW